MISILRDLLALAATFGLAGWLLGWLVVRDALGFARRTYLSLALAVPATVLVALPAALLDRITPAATLVGLALLATLAGLRNRHRAVAAMRSARLPSIRGRRTWAVRGLLAAAAITLAWIFVVSPQLGTLRDDGLPRQTTGWYYWWLAASIAGERDVPASLPEWGEPRPFQHAYIATSLHTAVSIQLAGGGHLAFQHRYAVLLVPLALIAFFALWGRWLPPWWAAIAAIVSMSSAKPLTKFLTYRPETFGLVLMLWSAWLIDEALERRSPRWGALAGVVFGCAFLAHAEAWLLGVPLWAGILAARLLFTGRRAKGERPSAAQPRSSLAARWVRTALPVIVAIPLYLGTVQVVSAAASEQLEPTFPGVAPGWSPRSADGTDLTWAVFAAAWAPRLLDSEPRLPADDPFGPPATYRPWRGVDLADPDGAALAPFAALGLLAAASYLVPAARRRRRRVAGPARTPGAGSALLVGGVFIAGTAAIALVTCLVYDTYVPQRAAIIRVLPYYALGVAGLLAVLALAAARGTSALLRSAAPVRRRPWARTLARVAAAALATTLVLLPVVGTTIPLPGGEQGVSPGAYRAYRWLDRRTPAGSVVLANAYTLGAGGALSGRTGWLDGRIPFLEAPPWPQQAVRRLMRARAYFAEPSRHAAGLPPEVDYVLAASRRINLGGPTPFRTDLRGLKRQPNLDLVAKFADGHVLVFRVDRAPHAGRRPAPAARRVGRAGLEPARDGL